MDGLEREEKIELGEKAEVWKTVHFLSIPTTSQYDKGANLKVIINF